MSSLVIELGHKEILSAETAVSLRNYIASRNPSLSDSHRAGIFADAVNRIIDEGIPEFDRRIAKKLKEVLFRDLASKPVFSIDCADVFKAAVKLDTIGHEFSSKLNEWLSGLLNREIARESLFEYVIMAHKLMNERPDESIANIMDSVEKNAGGLKYINSEYVVNNEQNVAEASQEISDETCDETCGHAQTNKEYTEPNSMPYSFSDDKKAGIPCILRNAVLSAIPGRTVPALLLLAAAVTIAVAGLTINAVHRITLPDPSPVASCQSLQAPAGNLSMSNGKTMHMRATAYDLSVQSCGKSPDHPLYGITSSGARAKVGRTVAVDPEVIPLGSRLYISFPTEYRGLDGIYTAEDTGRLIKGNSIDIFFGEDREGSRKIYESAMEFGVRYVDVKVLG